jgi:phospholipid/cholesterol/gamma-HCH transport system substrate-binding protein
MANLSTLMATIRSQDNTLAGALRTVPGGVAVLARDEKQIVSALRAASDLSVIADRVIGDSRANLLANLRDLQPAVARLADSGQNLIGSLNVLPTFPFPASEVTQDEFGDYGNMYLTFDLTLPDLEKGWLAGPSPAGAASGAASGTAAGTASGSPATPADNPLTNPLGGSGSGSGSSSGSGSRSSSGSGSGSGLGGVLGGLTGGGL